MQTGHLSRNLTVAEFLHTSHSDLMDEQELLWQSSPEIRANAYRLAEEVFEPVRAILGCALRVSSGLRSPELNLRVGGKPRSRHLFGLAIDCVPTVVDPHPAIFVLLHAMKRGELPRLDQAIVEGKSGARWLHLQAAMDTQPARQLVMESEDGRVFARIT